MSTAASAGISDWRPVETSRVWAWGFRYGVIGTVMGGYDGHRGWVYYVAVDPAHQGAGVGRRLMNACEEWVRAHGIPKIQLMVRDTNAHVIAFYEALGYVDGAVAVLGKFL